MSEHDDSVLKPEGPDWSTQLVAAFVVVIVVAAAMVAALTGWPDLLFVLHWLALVAAICAIAATISQALSGHGEEAVRSALAAVALLLAWYLTGPQVGWPQPHEHWGHWDPAVALFYLWRGWRQPHRRSCLPVCFPSVLHSPLASFFVIIV